MEALLLFGSPKVTIDLHVSQKEHGLNVIVKMSIRSTGLDCFGYTTTIQACLERKIYWLIIVVAKYTSM